MFEGQKSRTAMLAAVRSLELSRARALMSCDKEFVDAAQEGHFKYVGYALNDGMRFIFAKL